MFGGGHSLIFEIRCYQKQELAFIRLTRNESRVAIKVCFRSLFCIQPESAGTSSSPFAIRVIRTMAEKTVFRQYRANIAIEIDLGP